MRLWDRTSDARTLARDNTEVWAEVEGTEGTYLVSNLGRYFSTLTGTYLRGSQANTGYILYPVSVSPKKSTVAQRLVLTAFDGPPAEGQTDARHLDGCKTNNNLTNLKWGTRSENALDVWDAKRRGQPASTSNVRPRTNGSLTLTETQVRAAIRSFENGTSTLTALSELLDVSEDVVKGILVGETWPHIPRHMNAIQKRLGRNGEAHHKAKFSEDELVEALRIYTEEKKSGVWFAEALGIKQISAHMILSGKRWAHVPRPNGFQYPWPDAASRFNTQTGAQHHAAKHTEEDIRHVFACIMNGELNSAEAVGTRLGMRRGNVYELLRGESWVSVPRPEGFDDKVASFLRPNLPKEVQEQILQRLLSGGTRQDIIAEFQLSVSKASWYVTKANKLRRLDR